MPPSTGVSAARHGGGFLAILEIVAMLLAGNLLLWRLEALVHFVNVADVLRSAAKGGDSAQGTYVAFVLLLHLTLRASIFFATVFAYCRLRGYRDPFRFGLGTGGRRVSSLILLGLLAYCVGQLPTKLLAIAVHYHVMHVAPGGGGAGSYMFLRHSWGMGFWILYVTALCVVVPLHEEFFFRGYAQRRLEVEFGGPAAIVIGAAFFTLQHLDDYLYRLDTRNIVELLCMAFDAIVLGYVYWRTRSLVPCIIVHALGNAPLRTFENYLIVTAIIAVVLVVAHRRWLTPAREFLGALRQTNPAALGIATLLVMAAMIVVEVGRPTTFWLLPICGLLSCLCIFHRWRRGRGGPGLATVPAGAGDLR
jgi:membrane protease YdiL (CAAX protease family)